MLFDILERDALEQEEQEYFDTMDYIYYSEVMNNGCDDDCGECDDDDDKIALLRAEICRLKQENAALQDELEKVKGELQCLREALTILPVEE